ncbi:MAG: acyl-CoA dehydrogenase family protein [Acidimicrobiia bacterium]|nr:acyl-CoA dehydrogenase family protein [Acidimicrobiia bacterium]
MDYDLPSELEPLRAEATEVARRAARAREFQEDSWLIGNDAGFAAELGRRGWLGMTWPTEFGGHGRSPLERFVVFEAMISQGAPIASAWFADRQIGPTLLQFGTDAQRARHLPGLLAGTEMWSIGMSEPDAGSDVASVRTRAECDGDDFVVNGQKIWTSGALHSSFIYLIARTDPDAPPHAGLSEFIVDLSSPGVEIRTIKDMTGNEHFCEVHFSDVRVPAENLVGTPNNSFKQVMRQMEHERGGIDRLVSNRALYDDALALADRDDPTIRQDIARCETIYRIGRHMVLREVLGEAPAGWSALTKTLCTEFEIHVAGFCARVAGAEAMLWNRVSRNICYAPGYTIMGGTTQILRNIIGERVLGLPREPRPR